MVIPVGTIGGVQQLTLFTRSGDTIEETTLELARFVPLLDGAIR